MNFEDVYVIGDTPHEIIHGKTVNAPTLGVATRGHSINELAVFDPDYMFASLFGVKTL